MAIYFFDKNQTLIKIVPESATFEAIQTQELDDDSLLKDTLSVRVKGDEKLINAEYMAVKSYTGNAQTFDMYRIVTDTTPDKSMSFTGMSLAPYELNGHIIQDLRPTNQTISYTLNRILNGTDWQLGYIEDGLSNVTTNFYYVSAKEALKELQSLVGCEFVFKVEISGQKITNKWIEVYSEMGNRTKKRFNYGTNALTVVRETNKADIYTALIGRGKGEEVSSGEDNESGQSGYGRKITFEDIEWSIAKGNPLDKPKGQYYLELPQATQAYGIKNIDGTMKARVGIVDFDDEEDKNRLINLTYQQLLVSSRPKVLFKTTVANVGATGIGDTVTIHRHDLNIHYQTRVRKIIRNKLNDNKTQIELGDAVVTPSTKRDKQNNATIQNLNQEIEKVKADVTTSQTSADGKNTIFYGPVEPTRKHTGDIWYRPHPSIPGETQMLVWNGTAWELVIDTSDLTSVSREVEEAAEKAEEAVQAAKDADARANSALEKAGANASLLTTHQNTIETINTVTLPDIASSVGDALADAKSAMDEAKKADEKIADYVKENGLVSGTTVDSKIDTVKGEISGRITTLETNKLDNTTYTNFYENDYKITAQGVTDAWTAVNKIVDENGNSTDTFAKAVYDKNATRQSADFNEVTKDLVKEATYTAGINGVTKSISSVRGDLDSLSGGGRNYAVDTSNKMKYSLKVGAYSGLLDQDNKLTTKTKYTLSDLDAKVGDWYTASIYIGQSGGFGSSVKVYNQDVNSVRAKGNRAGHGYSSVTFKVLEGDTEFNFFLGNETGNNGTYYIEAKELQIEKGKIRTAWKPAISEQMGKAEFTIFKNDYEANDKAIKARLLAVDSGEKGSIAYRLNETESTASGNTGIISDIKKTPEKQITGYQTIKERSELYERVIGKDEEGIKSNMARMVMTDSLFKQEVIKNVPSAIGGRNYALKSDAYYFTSNYQVSEYYLSVIPKGTKIKISVWGGLDPGTRTYGVYINNSTGTPSGNSQKIELTKLSGLYGQGRSSSLSKWTAEATLLVDASKILIFGLDNNSSNLKRVEYVKVETGDYYTDWTPAPEDKASMSAITQLENNINLKVSKSDLISQINVQAGGVLITSGTNKLNVTPETTYIEDGTIKSAMIESLQADKITAGTLDAGKVKVINLDANNITANKTSFVQSVWNSLESSISINATGLLSKASDGSQVYLQNGIVGARNPSGATIGQIGYAYQTESPWYSMQVSYGSHFQIRMNRGAGELNKQAFYIISGGTESYLNTDNIYLNPASTGRVRVQGAMTIDKDLRTEGTILVRSRLEYLNGGVIESQSANSNMVISATNKLIIYTNGTNALEFDANNAVFRRKISENSDARLKTNIVDMPINSLDAIRNMEIKKFDYLDGRKNYYGIIAQQAQQHLPELINTDSEGYLMVDKSAMTYVNMHAIQQLDSKVDVVDNKVEQLEAKIASLQDELALLKGA